MMQQTWKQCDYAQSRRNNFNDDDENNDVNDNNDDSRRRATSSKILKKMTSMTNRFMIRDNHDLMQWMLNLRTYELKIHYNITIESYVDWVRD